MREDRILTMTDIARLRLAYIKRLQAENAKLKSELNRLFAASKPSSSYWNRGSLLKAESKEKEEE